MEAAGRAAGTVNTPPRPNRTNSAGPGGILTRGGQSSRHSIGSSSRHPISLMPLGEGVDRLTGLDCKGSVVVSGWLSIKLAERLHRTHSCLGV